MTGSASPAAGEAQPPPPLADEKIRIGTLVRHDADGGPANYIRQILPHGFESFSMTFGRHLTGSTWPRWPPRSRKCWPSGPAVLSSISIYGNPLVDDVCRDGWRQLIDATDLFGCKIVAGFAGRIVDKPVPDSMPRFAEVFGPLAKQAADQGVRLAFENCEMGGNWDRGDWNIAHGPTAWEMMFNAVPLENIGLQWEPSHQMVQPDRLLAAIAEVRQARLPSPRQGRDDPLGRDPRVRHRRPEDVRLAPHAGLRRLQLDRRDHDPPARRLHRQHRHRGLARPGLPRRPGNDRPGRRAQLPQALPRRLVRAEPDMTVM